MPDPRMRLSPPSSGTQRAMQANRSKNTTPELELRKQLRDAGLSGYRLHWKQAPGSPDIAYPGRRVAVFVNGCFWHRCPHCDPPSPKSNADFWQAKFTANKSRDARIVSELEDSGWTVITVWECRLRLDPEAAVREIGAALNRGR